MSLILEEMCVRSVYLFAAVAKVKQGADSFLYSIQLIMSKGGRFTLSDDSHAVDHVGLNYQQVLTYIQDIGLQQIHYLEKLPMGEIGINVLDACAVRTLSLDELRNQIFWQL